MLAAYDSSDEGGLRRPLEALTPPDHVVPGRGS